jgi:hypothetical protein
MAHEHGVEHGVIIELKLVLFQHGHALTGSYLHGSLIGLYFAAKDLEEGGFTSPVCAYYAVAVATDKTEAYFIEQYPFSIGKGYISNTDHGNKLLLTLTGAKVRFLGERTCEENGKYQVVFSG